MNEKKIKTLTILKLAEKQKRVVDDDDRRRSIKLKELKLCRDLIDKRRHHLRVELAKAMRQHRKKLITRTKRNLKQCPDGDSERKAKEERWLLLLEACNVDELIEKRFNDDNDKDDDSSTVDDDSKLVSCRMFSGAQVQALLKRCLVSDDDAFFDAEFRSKYQGATLNKKKKRSTTRGKRVRRRNDEDDDERRSAAAGVPKRQRRAQVLDDSKPIDPDLHPSWQQRKAAKEKEKNAQWQGNRVRFDQDDSEKVSPLSKTQGNHTQFDRREPKIDPDLHPSWQQRKAAKEKERNAQWQGSRVQFD
jgi:hypothetical protein